MNHRKLIAGKAVGTYHVTEATYESHIKAGAVLKDSTGLNVACFHFLSASCSNTYLSTQLLLKDRKASSAAAELFGSTSSFIVKRRVRGEALSSYEVVVGIGGSLGSTGKADWLS